MNDAARRTRCWAFLIWSVFGLALGGACAYAPRIPDPQAAAGEVDREIELTQSIPEGLPLRDAELRPAAEVWRELFHAARTHIEVAQFYVQSEPGEAMAPVLDELIAAAGRGVQVRVLLSKTLQSNDPQTQARLKAVPGIEVRYLDLKPRTDGILHAKYLLVDDELLYLGSQNFDWRSLTQIHELGVRVRSARLASQLGQIFAFDWSLATPGVAGASEAPAASDAPTVPQSADPLLFSLPRKPAPPQSFAAPEIELVASPAAMIPGGTRSAIEVLVELLRGARQSVQVQLLKYSIYADHGRTMWPVIDAELRAAAARGVRVQLMVSHWNTTHPDIDHLKALTQVPGIAVRIVTVPELPGRFIPFARVIHSKYLIVDGQTLWVGTANWEPNMFLGCRNVELVMRRRSLAVQGERIFKTLWDSPYALAVDPQKEYLPRRIK